MPGIKPSEFYEVNEEGEKVKKVEKVEPKPKPKPVVKVKTEEKKYYTIKSGDSLSEIAARNKTTVSKLCELNGIKPSTKIQIGKSLRIR